MVGKSKSGFGFKSRFNQFYKSNWIWIWLENFQIHGFGFELFWKYIVVDLDLNIAGFGFENFKSTNKSTNPPLKIIWIWTPGFGFDHFWKGRIWIWIWPFLERWIWIWIWRFDRIWIWIWTLLDLPTFACEAQPGLVFYLWFLVSMRKFV